MMVKSAGCKKWLTRITVSCFFLAGGIEYSVILPTCFDYMTLTFDAEEWFYGLTLSAVSISNLLFGPLMGALYDRTHQTKLFVLFLNLFEIGGNFMYFAANSKWMVLGSRFVAGIGMSAGAIIFGEIARTSLKKERTAAFALFMSTRQIGLVIGPACNLFLRICNFKLGPFTVNKYTSPALFMVIVWIVMEAMFVFFFFALPPVGAEESANAAVSSGGFGHSVSNHAPQAQNSDKRKSWSNLNDDSGTEPLTLSNKGQIQSRAHTDSRTASETTSLLQGRECESSQRNLCVASVGLIRRVWWMTSELIREETVFLLGALFITLFSFMTLEAGLVPVVESLLGWHEMETSLFFCGAGVWIIVGFLAVTILSKRFADKWILMGGLVFQLIAYVWLMGFLGSGNKGSWVLGQLIIGAAFLILGLPFFIVAGNSLYSKLLPMEIQGFGQGVRRSTGSLSAILGPLWAGAAFDLTTDYKYYPYYGVPLALLTLAMILTLCSFSRLHEPKGAVLSHTNRSSFQEVKA